MTSPLNLSFKHFVQTKPYRLLLQCLALIVSALLVACSEASVKVSESNTEQAFSRAVMRPASVNTDDKFHPGNYMLVRKMGKIDLALFDAAVKNDDFRGVQVRYTWRELEKRKNQYDFSIIEKHLNYLQKHGKRLVIQIQDKSFSKKGKFVPNYLLKDPEYAGGVVKNKPGGFTPKKWNANVRKRLDALYHALGARFNDEPNIEGIVLVESIAGTWHTCKDKFRKNDYTAEAYRDGLIKLMSSAKDSFPNTTVIQYINGLDCAMHYLADIASHANAIGVGLGGPDIHPYNPWLTENAYQYYFKYRGKIPLGAAVQYNDYEFMTDKGVKITTEELLLYGKNTLGLNYIFWEVREPYFSQDVIPAIAKYRNLFQQQ